MTEFESDWRGWSLKVDQSDIADVMSSLDGGLALVEVNARPRELVKNLGNAAANLAVAADNKRVIYANQGQGSDSSLSNSLPEFADDIQGLMLALSEVITPTTKALCGVAEKEARLQFIYGYRHRHTGHVDEGIVTAWCGADKPGFFVVINGEKVFIPSIPEGHVLLMRGENASGHINMPGIRHGAVYRSSKVRRAVLLGY
jgi:hypothetical protein